MVTSGTGSTPTSSPACEAYSETPYSQTFKTIAYMLIISISIIGNSTVIYVVYKNYNERSITNWFICNLAASDILIAFTGMPNMITELYVSYWMFGSAVCKAVVYFQSVAVAVSVLTLVAVSGDRYLCVVSPLRSRPEVDKAKYIVLGIWVVSCSVMAPLISAQRVVEFNGKTRCIEEWGEPFDRIQAPKDYTIVLFVIMYVVPLTGMTFLYVAICRVLWKRKAPGVKIGQTEILLQKSRRRVIVMLLVVTIVFSLCWLPLWVFQFIMFFASHIIPCPESINAFYFTSLFLGHSNSAINPFLYSFFNKSFRDGFRNMSSWATTCFRCGISRVAPASTVLGTRQYSLRGTGQRKPTITGQENREVTAEEQ